MNGEISVTPSEKEIVMSWQSANNISVDKLKGEVHLH